MKKFKSIKRAIRRGHLFIYERINSATGNTFELFRRTGRGGGEFLNMCTKEGLPFESTQSQKNYYEALRLNGTT